VEDIDPALQLHRIDHAMGVSVRLSFELHHTRSKLRKRRRILSRLADLYLHQRKAQRAPRRLRKGGDVVLAARDPKQLTQLIWQICHQSSPPGRPPAPAARFTTPTAVCASSAARGDPAR